MTLISPVQTIFDSWFFIVFQIVEVAGEPGSRQAFLPRAPHVWFLLFYWLSPLGLQQTLGSPIVKCFFPSHFSPFLHPWPFSKTHLHLQSTFWPTALPLPYTIISLTIPSHTLLKNRYQRLDFLAPSGVGWYTSSCSVLVFGFPLSFFCFSQWLLLCFHYYCLFLFLLSKYSSVSQVSFPSSSTKHSHSFLHF